MSNYLVNNKKSTSFILCLKGIQWEVSLNHQNVRLRNPAAVARKERQGCSFLKNEKITTHETSNLTHSISMR